MRYVLDTFPEMQLTQQNPVIGGPGLIGGCPALNQKWLTATESPLVQRFDPSAASDTIGFFIAKFEKLGRTSQLPAGP